MRTRQRSKRKTKNANSEKNSKPPDLITWNLQDDINSTIRKKRIVALHFLTKCPIPELSQKIIFDISILKYQIKGLDFTDTEKLKTFKYKKSILEKVETIKKTIKIVETHSNNVHIKQYILKQKSYIKGLEYKI